MVYQRTSVQDEKSRHIGEPIFEYGVVSTINSDDMTDYYHKHKEYTWIHAGEDKWIFPWCRKVKISFSDFKLPDDTIGLITNTGLDFNTPTQLLLGNTILMRTRGLLPKKIEAGNPICLLTLIPVVRAHFVLNDYLSQHY